MTSFVSPELYKIMKKRAEEARSRAEETFTNIYGEEEGKKRVDIIVSQLIENNKD